MKGDDARRTAISRRTALGDIGIGIGGVALAGLLGGAARATAGAHPLAARPPHFAARAKSVILLFASGGVSHVDCFDPKPVLNTHSGQAVPEDLVKGQRFAFISGRPKLLGSPFAFRRHGACGMELSDLLPHLAAVADDTTLVRSVQTDNVNHTPAQLLFGTGHQLAGRPSLGAWTTYGLGAETADLPAFVLLSSGKLSGISMLHGAGFLPSVYQGVTFQAGATPIFHLSDPPGVTRADREATVRAINAVNAVRLTDVADPEIATRIAQYEVAFRMQAAAPELVDFSQESRATLDQYGEEQFMLWRRSYDVPPPPIDPDSEFAQTYDPRYAALPPDARPRTECLKDVVNRLIPYWEDVIVGEGLRRGQTVLVAAHGNSLRALVKHLDGISDADIAALNIPTGIPLVYRLDEDLRPIVAGGEYLDPEAAATAAAAVANQGR